MKKSNTDTIDTTRYDAIAREYKRALLSGHRDIATHIADELFSDAAFRRCIARYNRCRDNNARYESAHRMSDSEYVNEVYCTIFLNPDVMSQWNESHYSILSYIKMNSQAHGAVGLAVRDALNLVRPDYIENGTRIYNNVASTSASAQPDGPSIGDSLKSASDVESEALRDGDLDDDSEIVQLVRMSTGLTLVEMYMFITLTEAHTREEKRARIPIIRDIVEAFGADETVNTVEDIQRIWGRIRKKLLRGSMETLKRELQTRGLLRRDNRTHDTDADALIEEIKNALSLLAV